MNADEFLVAVIKPWLAKEPASPESELTSEEVKKALDAYAAGLVVNANNAKILAMQNRHGISEG